VKTNDGVLVSCLYPWAASQIIAGNPCELHRDGFCAPDFESMRKHGGEGKIDVSALDG